MEYYARACFLSVVFTSRCVGKNFDISLDLRSREISNFPTHLEVNKTDRKRTLS